jgi:DNA-binding CsgD family transcriptional regulator
MSGPETLRMAELRRIDRLVGECGELGADFAAWQRHLVAGLLGLTGGAVGLGSELAGFRRGELRFRGMTEWGWPSASDRAAYYAGHAEIVRDPDASLSFTAYQRRSLADDGLCTTGVELFGTRGWWATWDYDHVLRPAGVGDVLWCIRSIPGPTGDGSYGVVLHRPRTGKPFGTRDRALVWAAIERLAPMVGGPLAGSAEPSPGDLPPRVRRVLRCLLEGDTDKQIAARMRLSVHTVNQYTKEVYRHFGTRGRTELMALWIRRRWGLPAPE